MCLPQKAPKQDPAIAQQQAAQRQLELDRLAEEKEKAKVAARRALPTGGMASLLSPGNSGSGFSKRGNYTA